MLIRLLVWVAVFSMRRIVRSHKSGTIDALYRKHEALSAASGNDPLATPILFALEHMMAVIEPHVN